jgi:hypothetical protein
MKLLGTKYFVIKLLGDEKELIRIAILGFLNERNIMNISLCGCEKRGTWSFEMLRAFQKFYGF